jgi:hypothetical protein
MKTSSHDASTLSRPSPQLWEQIAIFLLLLMLALALTLSVLRGREAIFTVSAVTHGRILVADEKETIEHLIDCTVVSRCDSGLVMKLMASGSVFFVEPGTRVSADNGFTLSNVRRVRILNGSHSGREVWINARLLK